MSLTLARSITTIDPRLAAFLSPAAAAVFHSAVGTSEVWRPDPYDVESIHADARQTFEDSFNRSNRGAPGAKILRLLGEAGSGKTHLLRAFRHRVHASGGYCCSMQMASSAGNYAHYALRNLIDSLGQPYRLPDPTTGLARLSLGLLETIPRLDASEGQQFRDGLVSADERPGRVNQYADWALSDLGIVRPAICHHRPQLDSCLAVPPVRGRSHQEPNHPLAA